ncbi:MAG: NEAT domain-containing protein [bacterium]|nr:NEAT domain-containing protein [bacterium]
MKKRLMSMVLALVMILMQANVVAFAAEGATKGSEVTYDLEVGLWKADTNEASMANAVFTGKSKLVESNGKKTMVVYAQPMTFMGITAYLEKLEVMQADGSYKTAEITEKDAAGNATAFSYEITELTEYMNVLVYYGGRPVGSSARIKVLNYSELVPVKTYPLTVELWNASKDTVSMGNDAFTGKAELVVSKDKTSIVVYTQPMEYLGMKGYVYDFSVEDNTGAYKDATVLSKDTNGIPTSFSFEITKLQEFFNVKADARLDGHPSEARLKIVNYSDYVTGGDQEESKPENTPAGDALSKVENGVFEVAVDLYKEASDSVSMAGDAVRKTARIQVVNGTATMYLYTKDLTMAGLTASFKELQIKQADGSYVTATVAKKDSNGYNSLFTFKLPSYEEYIGVKVDAGIDFMGVQNARIHVDYTTLKEVDKTTDLTVFPGQTVMSATTVAAIGNQTYTGSALKPSVVVKSGTKTLVAGTDYTVAYSNNKAVGTATVKITGKGNYTGTKTVTFKIVARNISGAAVSPIGTKTYTGSALRPSVVVKNGTVTLAAGTDYTVTYSNNKAVGTATVKITGKGNYTGTKTVTFKIAKRSISSAAASSIGTKTYTGSAIKPGVTLKYNGIKLKNGTDYTVKYSNNKATGKATITITGKGNFTGTKKVTFNIVPKKPVISKAVSSKTKSATVTVKKVTGATGYQISYATSKNGTYKAAGTTTTKTSYTVKGLKKNKTVYVKVRAYKVINGKKVYGSYSAVKAVKVK